MTEADAEKPGPERGGPNVPLRALGAGLALLLGGIAVARVATAAVVTQSRPTLEDFAASTRRMSQFVDALDGIAEQKGSPTFVLGTSLAFFGFSPEQFDEVVKERGFNLTSYTAATAAVSPSVQLLLARKIRSVFHDHRRRVSTSLVEFTPHAMTERTLEYLPFHQVELHGQAEFLDLPTFEQLVVRAPDEAAHVVALKALGNEEVNRVDAALAELFLTSPEFKRREELALRFGLLGALQQIEGGTFPAWNPRTRGETRWFYPATARQYFGMVARFNASKPAHVRRLVFENDAVELHMSARRVAEFIEIVKTLQSISRRTYIWIAPRNVALLMPSREGLGRMLDALKEITDATGAPLIDMMFTPEIGPEDFIDATHLSEHLGRPKFMKVFGSRVADLLSAERANAKAEKP